MSEKLAAEIAEFADDRKQLAEAKAQYAVAIRENTDALKSFVFERLAAEIEELHADQKVMSENFSKLEEFVVEALSKEIAESHQDKQDLAETKVRLIREAKEHFAKVRKNFIEKSSKVVSDTVSKVLTKEISQLKEDIDSARKNDFGRKLFETFSEEYASSYLNEKSETAKLLKVVILKEAELEEAAKIVAEAQEQVESRERELRVIKENSQRKEVMSELLGPLTGDKREVMGSLLESVQTEKLRTAFDKYLPAVMNGNTPAKKVLSEGKEITGDKQAPQSSESEGKTAEIFDIRRLAGLKV